METVTVRMSRSDGSTSWGFRLEGGIEFNTPLSIGKVTPGSLADRAGLHEGDSLVQVAGRTADGLRHKEAQDVILSSGNEIDLVVQRGATTIWQPSIMPVIPSVPMEPLARTPTAPTPPPVKYSLAHESRQETRHVGSGHNVTPKPFGASQSPGPLAGTGGSGFTGTSSTSKVVHSQYNSPAGLYSPSTAVEAYLQQTGGLFGTDPNLAKKEEPKFLKSETLRLIQETEMNKSRGAHVHVEAPRDAAAAAAAPGGSLVCESCGRNILGVFCKVGGKTFHPDCFNCATCGNSLKNIGHYQINDKLYCDVHARQFQGSLYKAAPPQDPSIFAPRAPPPPPPPKHADPVKAFYQPQILTPGGEMHRQSHASSISPSVRGVPSQSPHRFDASPVPAGAQATSSPSAPLSGAPFTATQGTGARSTLGSANSQTITGTRSIRRSQGVLKHSYDGPRIPMCEACHREIRGPFILALGKSWCPEHFICGNGKCQRKLQDIGFVEENGQIYCEYCFEQYFAPPCAKCQRPVVGDCLNALDRQWHPECFTCAHCHKAFGNSAFFLEDGKPFCEADWNGLFTTKCVSCQFPIEAGDRWVEALGNSFHSDCFSCTMCHKNLEGQSFYAKGGRPFCKNHA